MFPTPSGKCELYSERMKADGLDPLPTYIPPLEDPQTRPELAAKYPLQLLSPPRPAVPELDIRQSAPPSARGRRARRSSSPTADAAARGLADGEWAEVFNDRGRFQARVALDRQRATRRGRRHRNLLEQAHPRRVERQQHDLLGPDRHGRRGDVLR